MWLRPERPVRDRRLSRALITVAAVEILDAEGLEGLSMRRIADRLGVTAGSLYWYVATKDELLELALDAVTGEICSPATEPGAPGGPPGSDGWRDALAAIARSRRAMLLRHPWVVPLMSTLPDMGPNALRAAERALRILTSAGFGPDKAADALAAISNQVTGAVVAEIAWRELARGPAGTLADWQRDAAAYMSQIGEQHPLLAARFAADPPDIETVSAARFAFALGCLLDGLAARLPARHAPRGQGGR